MNKAGNDISREKVKLNLVQKANVYKPRIQLREGTHEDGTKYQVRIKEPDPPPGTGAQGVPDENITTIAWDELLYIAWEESSGVTAQFDILLELNGGGVVSKLEGLSPDVKNYTFENGEAGLVITNGTAYDITLIKVVTPTEYNSNPVTLTPSNKVPQNVAKDSQTTSEITLTWDTVTGDVAGYELVLKNSTTGAESVRKFLTSSPGTAAIPGIGLFDVFVESVSTLKLFNSDPSSTIQVYISEEITNLNAVFTGGVDEIDLTWTGTSLADSYDVYYRPQGGSFSLFENTALTSRTYDAFDFGNGVWEFKVVPIKNGLDGKDSNIDSAEVDVPVFIVTEDDMVETVENQVFDGSDVEFVVTESDMNETVTNS